VASPTLEQRTFNAGGTISSDTWPRADFDEREFQAKREYAQLLRLHDRLLLQVQRVLEDLTSAQIDTLLDDIKRRTGKAPDLAEVREALEEAVRALKLSQSNIRGTVFDQQHPPSLEGMPDLPSPLQRFLAEHVQTPGFSYDLAQDEVRGWVIRWKEYTPQGTIRGYGQFYERPYAYLDD
jgi:hypothetical protein